MIVDCHVHAGLGPGWSGPWDTSARLGEYLKRADRAGISRSILFSTFHTDYSVANRQVARIVARYPDRFFGFAFVHPIRDAGRVEKLVREAVEDYGFCGIKVHRHDGRITREICEVAQAFSLPILYDVMGEVSTVELLADEYPGPFIIPHLGSFADDWKAQVSLLGILFRHSNVYTDTSAVRRFDLLQEAVKAWPRVLYGSDGPWLHPGVELAKIYELGLPPAAERAVLGGNVLRLIGRARAAWRCGSRSRQWARAGWRATRGTTRPASS